MDKPTISLSESEYKVLTKAVENLDRDKEYSIVEVAEILGEDRSRLEAIFRLLSSKNLVRIREEEIEEVVVSDEGKKYLEEGFPEEKLVNILRREGGQITLDRAREALGDLLDIAIINAARKKWIVLSEGTIRLSTTTSVSAEERDYLRKVASGEKITSSELRALKKRRLVRVVKKKHTYVIIPKDIDYLLSRIVVEVGALTKDYLVSGRWRQIRLREYNIAAQPPKLRPGRTHFFQDFIEFLRDIMKELGFVEVVDSPVELEFWNYDILYQPQYHPARSETDTFYLYYPSLGDIDPSLAERVAIAHSKGVAGSTGWGYKWSEEIARKLILRSHTTAVSARILARKPKPPFRFFTIGRVYRVEKVDAKHLPEFHQMDGIASEENTNLRWLLGMLSEILERMGFSEYKFRFAYFPFTEPSIEGYVKIGDTWIEILGAGLFRPEMLEVLGVNYPVAAWGIGLERLVMALYGLNDIRQLYSGEVEFIQSMKIRWKKHANI